MSIDVTPTETSSATEPTRGPEGRRRLRRTLAIGAVGAALVAGAAGLSSAQTVIPTTVPPIAISALAPSGATAVKGEVAEIFGNKFVVQDSSGRALVETGREGEGGMLVTKGESVTVQGRFEKGFLHARVLTRGDGTIVRMGPADGPPMASLDWARDRVGLGERFDVPALTRAVEQAGYTDVRVTGRGPKHLEVAAKRDGQERELHVGFDGRVRERPPL
ncbi:MULTISPECIES: DNA-binding protein [Methylobacterium]|uniref:DNA-binding protein n=2 Tax=Pseudomonadota TaxID=1224 RepID=A0ABQ4SUB3_9HYPH|nr:MULTISPECIES: DNA-binding protein [Methylobacterium]GBU17801.1 hypothetical protein AwMethylo_20160 [Methylobacterium sp.]GJE06776.1 hypothetical protein AOPFMNJM_2098 [Methylobacterium jeotgali]